MDEQNVVYSCNGIFLSNKKEQTTHTYYTYYNVKQSKENQIEKTMYKSYVHKIPFI